MKWTDIEAQARWMPLGRTGNKDNWLPKAPARGYTNNKPSTWMVKAKVETELAGVNFGFGGLVGLDFDVKPELLDARARPAIDAAFAKVMDALPGPIESSVSGNGKHLFALPDSALAAELAEVARKPYVLSWVETEKGYKPAAAVELFGGGNAFIAVTGKWEEGRAPEGDLPTITGDMLWTALSGLPVAVKPRTARSVSGGAQVKGNAYERLAAILNQLPVPGDYDGWLRLISALKNSGFSADEVEAWSALGPGYVKGEVYAKWNSLLTQIQAGTAIQAAQEAGLLPKRYIPKRRVHYRAIENPRPTIYAKMPCGVCGGDEDLIKGKGDYMLCRDPRKCAAQCRANQKERVA